MMSIFFKSHFVLGLLVLCVFKLFFVETHPNFLQQAEEKPGLQVFLPGSQEPNFMKKIGSKEYIARVAFSTFPSPMNGTTTPTQNTDNDTLYYDSELDSNDTFSLICDDVEFECQSDQSCIPLESYCDGEKDCEDDSDERMCASTPTIHFSIINETTTTTSPETSPITTNNPEIIFLILFLFIIIIVSNREKILNLIVRKRNS